ncbi:hypothetical protein RB653_006895 [Dictyostelium firmibasis]|uniref:Importin N-terminal domain-containing protein n=1 Tax=Dictyostelium firmibasis TaxID=79012 RepID=A0AAN7YNI7_9MYCE
MDPIIQTIQLFQHTLHHDANVIKAAEAQLQQIKVTEGYSRILLKILASNEVDISIKQGVSIFLKNMIIAKWRGVEGESPITEEDGEFIKENLIDLLVHSHHLVQNQIEAMIEIIANRDFPDKWASLLPKSIQYINTQDVKLILAGLTSIQLGIKRFRYITMGDKKKETLYKIVNDVFPLLLQILEFLSQHQTVESALMQKKLIKIFGYAIHFEIPDYLIQPEIFNKWLSQFVRIIQRTITPQENVKFAEDCRKNQWWLLKRTTAKLLNLLFRKSATSVRSTDHPSTKALNKLYMPVYSVEIMKVYYDQLSTLESLYKGIHYERYQQKLVEYFSFAVKYGVTYVAMKPMLPTLIQQVFFPIICFNDKDAELWECDPHEFLRSQFESSMNFATARIEVLNFMIDVVGKRGRANLDMIMGFCIQLLNKYNSATDASEKNPRQKDGVLIIISVLSAYLKNISFYKSNLEQMLLLHVFPELTSQYGFLKARACSLFSEFYNIQFTDPVYFSNALKIILGLMSDNDLPVRVKAGASICNLVRANQGVDELRPILPQLLDKIFSLLSEAESEDLVIAIESIIQRFKHEIAPYAVNLCKNLSEQFLRLLELESSDETGESGMATQDCLGVYCTLLRALKDIPDVFNALEQQIVPILKILFTPDHMMYLDEALRILTFITYYPKSISPSLWSLFPQIMGLFDECACDFASSYVNPLDNYISYGTEHFISTPQYIEMVFNMYKKMVGDISQQPVDAGDTCKIMESLIQRAKGRIDNIIAPVMEIACARLLNNDKNNQKSKEFVVYLLEIIANCIYYNPSIAIQYLESNNLIEPIFGLWFTKIKHFQRFYDKKISVLAFSSLLTLNPSPNFVKHGSSLILDKMLLFTKDMLSIEKELDKQQAEREEKIKNGTLKPDEEYADDEEDDEEDYFDNHKFEFEFTEIPDDQDCQHDDEGEVFLDDIERATEYFENGGDLGEDEADNFDEEDNDQDSDEDLFEDEDSPDFETPIDEVDGFDYMISAIQQFFQLNPNCIQQITEKQQEKIKKYVASAPARKEKLRLEKEKEEKEKLKQQQKK